MNKLNLNINGMHCESCAKLIIMELGEEPGVGEIKINYRDGSAAVEFDPQKIDSEKIFSIISELGYQAKEI